MKILVTERSKKTLKVDAMKIWRLVNAEELATASDVWTAAVDYKDGPSASLPSSPGGGP